ncbi:phage portal protein, lambda family [Paraburkholderia xenovorans LB400]|uniref:Phage portal protein Gp17 n=2 Tax=Paraburkholderia xenovorans TaxID=36873 RepID=Q141S4_PARXL|nr:Putative phage portal protein Gp17 [Paraburkholderia xenovorans LB400]AIP30406.1 phage portal protein, lambda family [Paraburkholderia xenovorans LB400]
MSSAAILVDASGRPLRARANTGAGPGTLANNVGRAFFPYQAADWQTQEMGAWLPWIRSPDAEINQFRDRMVARSRDQVRNDGRSSGGITRILDNAVGASLRLSAAPDYRALAEISGAAFDIKWANEFRRAVEARWRLFSNDFGRYNDVSRQLTVSQQLRLALRHKLIDGEDLVINYWMPERVGRGGARYATAYLVVDPDRLSNPNQMVDTRHMRNGVEVDENGVPLAYHIRKAHQNDWYNSVESMIWERVEREDDDGWLRVIHDFERDRAGQNRGVGVFIPVLAHAKMLARYYGIELQAAALAASIGTYVTSPYDPSEVQDAVGGEDHELGYYQGLRAEWNEERPAMFNGVRVPALAPGEDIKAFTSDHPHNGFTEFVHEMQGCVASALGISLEQVTQDWSRSNYSNMRGSLLESWKTLIRRRLEFSAGTATPMYAVWLRESMENGELPLPAGAPDFLDGVTAYAGCSWLGPARGWVDPVKEPQGSILKMDAALTTLKQEAAEQGSDWEELLDQRQIEIEAFRERGIPLPEWGGSEMATRTDEPPQEPQAA